MRRVLLTNLDGRNCWHGVTVVGGILSLAAVVTVSFTPRTAAGQGNRTKVTYTVEFSTTGALLDQTCAAAAGTDVLTGTMVGLEPPLPNEDNVYVGTLTRTTRIKTCGIVRNAAGIDAVCSIDYVGNGFADVMFTLHEGQRGGYLEYITDRRPWASQLPPRPAGRVNSVVTGNCDPAERAQLQNDYDKGETAGSPNGQPLEVPGFWPLSPRPPFPYPFPPKPPQSIWTLTVLDRRP